MFCIAFTPEYLLSNQTEFCFQEEKNNTLTKCHYQQIALTVLPLSKSFNMVDKEDTINEDNLFSSDASEPLTFFDHGKNEF